MKELTFPQKGSVTNSDIIPVMSVGGRKKLLPTIISRIVMGARMMHPWNGRNDIVQVEDEYGSTRLSLSDFTVAKEVADKIVRELGLKRMVPAHQVLVIRDLAQDILERMTDERAGKRGIVMLKDKGGCGYWRMVLPSRYMNLDGIYIDVTGGVVDFSNLLEYDTIFVQREHNWESFGVLERLKSAGKRIIYDIDDDLFSIPEGNPASKMMGRGEQMAAVECMKLADVVTTSTEVLKDRLTQILEGRVPVVVPNALDVDEAWQPTPLIGSPDGWRRIFWQGSNTHDEDWNECFEAVDHVMQIHEDVRMVILGYLPSMVQRSVSQSHWRNRIEFLGPVEPEAYFRLIKHIRAEVGLAPLGSNWFNKAKSNIKWIENTMIGMPTVASDIRPYSDEITSGETGFVCSTRAEWIDAIEKCLNDERLRKTMVEKARKKIRDEFNIKNVSQVWRKILIGEEEGSVSNI